MGERRARVLIVDDEDNIVLALHRVLYQDNGRYDVLLARNAEIAQQILTDLTVDVLVTDVHLPAQSGMDLLSWVAVKAPSTRVIIMTAFDVMGIKDKAHAHGCLRLIRKPFDVHDMHATIVRALSQRDSFTGSLAELSCVDVIQMLCIARKNAALRIAEGTSAGVIHIETGEIVHAVWDEFIGKEALLRILTVKRGLFYTSPLPPDVERSIRGDWQHLLIESLQHLDETGAPGVIPANDDESAGAASQRGPMRRALASGTRTIDPESALLRGHDENALTLARLSSGQTNDPAPPDAEPTPRKADVARLIDNGFSALRTGKREDARRAWEEALRLDPSNRMIELNLRKLGPSAEEAEPPARTGS